MELEDTTYTLVNPNWYEESMDNHILENLDYGLPIQELTEEIVNRAVGDIYNIVEKARVTYCSGNDRITRQLAESPGFIVYSFYPKIISSLRFANQLTYVDPNLDSNNFDTSKHASEDFKDYIARLASYLPERENIWREYEEDLRTSNTAMIIEILLIQLCKEADRRKLEIPKKDLEESSI